MAVAVEEVRQTLIGAEVERIDAVPKVNGGAEFTDDLQPSGMLEADLLISPYPYARILSIDMSAARRLPGVAVVLTGDDVEGLYGNTITYLLISTDSWICYLYIRNYFSSHKIQIIFNQRNSTTSTSWHCSCFAN